MNSKPQTVNCKQDCLMERHYWEHIAPDYDDEIFDVLKNDKKGHIRRSIRLAAGPHKEVIDIGCAVGKWLPVLSPLFRKVVAVDISAANLQIARQRHAHLDNVEYKRADMSARRSSFKNFDAALCINAILTPVRAKQIAFFRNIASCLKKGGTLILVVPSLESWLLTRIIQQRWKIDRQLFNVPAQALAARRYKDILQGNAEIDDVATKHYLGDELDLLLEQNGFRVAARKKIEYNWHTEFIRPPQWLKKPAPWDWMVRGEKV